MFFHQICYLVQHFPSVFGIFPPPRAIVKSISCSSYSLIYIMTICLLNLGENLAGCWIYCIESLS